VANKHGAITAEQAYYISSGTPADGDVVVGSVWVDPDDGKLYICTSLGPAVWTEHVTGTGNIVEDTTPQLGGALDGQGFDLNNMGVLFLTQQPHWGRRLQIVSLLLQLVRERLPMSREQLFVLVLGWPSAQTCRLMMQS